METIRLRNADGTASQVKVDGFSYIRVTFAFAIAGVIITDIWAFLIWTGIVQ